jgi:hypothetical protein
MMDDTRCWLARRFGLGFWYFYTTIYMFYDDIRYTATLNYKV